MTHKKKREEIRRQLYLILTLSHFFCFFFFRYKEKMIELKNKVNDNPYDLENNLVWWTEYVIRHKGAPHLRSSLAGQPWYQRGDMDIVVFLTIVTFIVVSYLLRLIIKFTISFCKRWQTLPVNYTKKIS